MSPGPGTWQVHTTRWVPRAPWPHLSRGQGSHGGAPRGHPHGCHTPGPACSCTPHTCHPGAPVRCVLTGPGVAARASETPPPPLPPGPSSTWEPPASLWPSGLGVPLSTPTPEGCCVGSRPVRGEGGGDGVQPQGQPRVRLFRPAKFLIKNKIPLKLIL